LDAKAKVAPSVHFALRQTLQEQQMSPAAIEDYLGRLASLSRYDKPFRVVWAMLVDQGVQPQKATVAEVISVLVKLHAWSPSQARNAYSALVLFPHLQALRFHQALVPYKKLWNCNVQKYASFWSAGDVLQALAATQLKPGDVAALRDRLILCCCLLALHRGVDLSRVVRTVSMVQGQPYILLKRKGWKTFKWEQVISLPQHPGISPWHLLQAYVQATQGHCDPGGPFLLQLTPPYRPLTANTVNSITKKLLLNLGVPMSVWGAHSTRGAGVSFYKSLGLTSEQVCEIGQWKNAQAFSAHYLRLNAAQSVQDRMAHFLPRQGVHNISPGYCAQPEWSCTPGMKDTGGSDHEGEQQENGEPTPLPEKWLQEK
jgi:hypothetical protein